MISYFIWFLSLVVSLISGYIWGQYTSQKYFLNTIETLKQEVGTAKKTVDELKQRSLKLINDLKDIQKQLKKG